MSQRFFSGSFFRRACSIVCAIMLLLVLLSPTAAALLSIDEADAGAASRVPWRWPSGTPVAVTRPFDPPSQDWLSGHRGVDLAVPVGSEVYSPAAGTVTFAGHLVDRNVVVIEHDHRRSTFEPVAPIVSLGDHVEAGQPIGIVEEGHAPGPLHWGVKVGPKRYLNPLRQLLSPVVLKPW